MNIYIALLLFSIGFLVFLWGIRVWWLDRYSRQNLAFFGMAAMTFIWAGSLAVMMFCPEKHSPVYAWTSVWSATMFAVFVFLFLLTFYPVSKFYYVMCVLGPVLGTLVCILRKWENGYEMIRTRFGLFYVDRVCAANIIFYGFLIVLGVAAVTILVLHRISANFHREKICLNIWIALLIFFILGVFGAGIYNMTHGIPTAPYEGFACCFGTIIFYWIADYADMIDIPNKKVKEYVTSFLTTPVVFVDYKGRITYYNECYRTFFGLEGRILGTDRFYPNLLTERTLEEAIDYVTKEDLSQGSFKAKTLDGERIMNIRYTILYDRFGETKCIINIINDVTEEEKLMEKLEKQTALAEKNRQDAVYANEAKSGFLANMSHEIRTPLNAIIGMNEMVMREQISPQAQQYSQDIYNAGQTLLAIINDILDFSKIESGKMEIVPVTYELSSVLNDVINMVTKKVQDKGLEFKTDVATDIPYQLFGDEVRIRQILLNIVNNAVKYTQEGSVTLKVDWEWSDDVKLLLKLSVIDTGIGIKEEDLQKLFKGFQRVDVMKNRNIEGTGLGLAITKRLTEQMEGTIDVESEYGKGSTFTVTLPQVVMNDTPMGDFSSAFQKMHRSRAEEPDNFLAPDARILIVDDNKVNLVVAKGLIKKTKIQVEGVQSGMEALERIKTNRYDIILLDHMMPEMNGLETIKRMKEQEENMSRDATIIALTANAISGSREMYMAAGFNDYLSKPIDVVRYTDMIKKYLPKELIHSAGDGV